MLELNEPTIIPLYDSEHQVTQNLLCNRLHAIEQRLAKWLLIIRDRIDTDELHLTQDFLSHMLGRPPAGHIDRRHGAGNRRRNAVGSTIAERRS